MLETGGGKRQKSYIFCLLWFIFTFSSPTAFARGGWLELQTPHLPVASPQVGSQWQVRPDWPQLRTLPMCLGNLLHSILQETADKISIQRCRGGSGLLKQQANRWHLQHGWAGTLLEDRSQRGTILWKHLLVPAFLLGIDRKVRWRTLYTCSALLFPGILSPKMTGQLAGSCIAQGLWNRSRAAKKEGHVPTH